MASSRLEKIGTIVTRTQGLMKSGAMMFEERPLWYDVVTAFPPKEDPRYDRPASKVPVRPIFYQEDTIRAKFHKLNKAQYVTNMTDQQNRTPTQHFIEIYRHLEQQGALDEERVFEAATDLLSDRLREQREQRTEAANARIVEQPVAVPSETPAKTVQIQDIFKD